MVIYKITNLVNDKIYVGQTVRSLDLRFKEHSTATSLLGRDIRKFGKENFKIEIIERCENIPQLNHQEKFWIEKLNCKTPNGYNVAEGGGGYGGCQGSLTGRKIHVLEYILKNMDSNNKLFETVTEISQHSGISRPTVTETLQLLESDNLVARKTGTIMLNPKIAHRGDARRERYLLTKFFEIQFPNAKNIEVPQEIKEQPA